MIRTEIEFKIRLKDEVEKNKFYLILQREFDIKLADKKHLECDWSFNFSGDYKFRARYLIYLIGDDLDPNESRKFITLKMPRHRDLTVKSGNEIEFEINNDDFFHTNEFDQIRRCLKRIKISPGGNHFFFWCKNLKQEIKINDFNRAVNTIYPAIIANKREKIRETFKFIFAGETVEICFDQFPSRKIEGKQTYADHFYLEFSVSSFKIIKDLKQRIAKILNIDIDQIDTRGYGKIIKEENLGFSFGLY